MWTKIIIIVLSLELLHKAESQSRCSAATRFTCRDGICISKAKVCNGKVDCSGGEDESDCDGRAQCRPRDKNMASLNGYSCSNPCRKKSQSCQGRATQCICDDECRRSCINERTRCIQDPPTVENAVIRRKRYYYGDVAIYRCRRGLTLRGPSPRCTGHGVWSAEIPECVDTRCHEEKPTVYHSVDSYAMRNVEGRGEVVRSPPYHVGDVLSYVCECGRTLQGHLPRCGEDGRWSQDVPTCVDFDECGLAGEVLLTRDLLSNVVGGYDAVKNSWPWFALITNKTTTPEESLRSDNLIGGGSVINKNWALTAAHVLSGKEKSNYCVFVGLSERVLDQDTEVYSIAEYVEHPNFNDFANYNNDIALIKLGSKLDDNMNPISNDFSSLNFGPYIRAICFSACSIQDSTAVEQCNSEEQMTRGHAVVIGFGHTEPILNPRQNTRLIHPTKLKQATLRIEDRITCRNALNDIQSRIGNRNHLDFTENMLCFGPPDNNDDDACRGDSGGPLMTQVPGPENGTFRWVQVGIVSFGYGCGTGTPAFYTDVSKFTSWISEKIAEEEEEIANECDDGVTYNGKCYFAILHRAHDIPFDQRESICNGAGGTIAGIWNKQHQTLIENYVRAIMQISDLRDYTWIWLVMTYDNSTKTLRMPNGKSFPSTTFRCLPGVPYSDTRYTAVKIRVNKDESSSNQGIFNHPPSYDAPGLLCVK